MPPRIDEVPGWAYENSKPLQDMTLCFQERDQRFCHACEARAICCFGTCDRRNPSCQKCKWGTACATVIPFKERFSTLSSAIEYARNASDLLESHFHGENLKKLLEWMEEFHEYKIRRETQTPLEFPCPTCQAAPDQSCKTRNGQSCGIHKAREKLLG